MYNMITLFCGRNAVSMPFRVNDICCFEFYNSRYLPFNHCIPKKRYHWFLPLLILNLSWICFLIFGVDNRWDWYSDAEHPTHNLQPATASRIAGLQDCEIGWFCNPKYQLSDIIHTKNQKINIKKIIESKRQEYIIFLRLQLC